MSEVMLSRSPYVIVGILMPNISEGLKTHITPSMIMNIVSDYFNLMKISLTHKKREQTLVYPRMMAMYFIRENTRLSLKEIGKLFYPAVTHHTTVMHSISTIKDQLSLPKENTTKQDVVNITKIIFNYIEAISNN